MKISTFGYQFKQGFKNIHRNRLFSIASIATIAACIFLFGVFYSIAANSQHMIKNAASDSRISAIGEEIKLREEVDHVEFTTAEEAWENFKSQYFGEYEYLAEGFKDDNPLANSASYSVYLADTSKQDTLVTYLEGIENVRQVNKSTEVAQNISTAAKLAGYVSIAVIIILLAVSIFLITNTIVLGITVRKDEISIMKYVGATDGFVNAPFFVEGIAIGIIGSIIPLVALFFLYRQIIEFVMTRFSMLNNLLAFLPVMTVFKVLIPVSLLLGLAIGILGSLFALRKHENV